MKVFAAAVFAVFVGCSGTSASGQSLVLRHAEVPTYPGLALAAGLEATVRVRVTIRKGAVSDATVLESTGPGAFVKSTLANIRTWEFEDGVDTTFVTTFTYEMTNTVTELPENPRLELSLPLQVHLFGSRPKPRTRNDPAPIPSKRPAK